MKEGSLCTCLKAGKKQVVHSYGLGISAQMSTLKSSMDCADTIYWLAGHSRVGSQMGRRSTGRRLQSNSMKGIVVGDL